MVVGSIAAAGVYFLRAHRAVTTSDLISLLPAANATVVYADVAAIRRAGILNILAGSKTAEEPEYRQFLEQTKFDYQQDLAAVAAAFRDGQVFLAVRGRFRWKNLADYARHQGGSCHGDYCVMPGSRPDRRISFYPVQSDLMGMAISPDDFAAYQVTRQSGKLNMDLPNQPVWALVQAAAFKEPGVLPAGTKAYVSALESAEQALFTIGPANDRLQLGVEVTCRDAAAATALLGNLERITATLRNLIAREHQKANPADLSGVLVGGTFHRDERRVEGQWPIPEAFVKAIAGGAL